MSEFSRRSFLKTSAVAVAAAASRPARGATSRETLLIEAEAFDDYGRWVRDPQFMDVMGSPYLMAHGLGKPVADAVTTVDIPQAGAYRVFVRTVNWAAQFDAPGAPGQFQLAFNGTSLNEIFGTDGAEWSWHDGGAVDLSAGPVELRLQDLTGFNGRCDAIVLTSELGFVPPNEPRKLARFRREALGLLTTPDDEGVYDLVVVGGGMAGGSAAISAARLGLSVALIQDRPVQGGNNSSEIRVPMRGGVHWPPYRALGGVVYELGPDHYAPDEHKETVLRAEPNIALFLDTRMVEVETDGNRIVAVIAQNVRTGRQIRFSGRCFADCTGDGNLGFAAGADYRYGRESYSETGESDAPEERDNQVMGATLKWESEEAEEPNDFPETPWAVQFDEGNYQKAVRGSWNWEAGYFWDQVNEAEKIRDHLLRAIFGNWSFQKNHAPDKDRYANLQLKWAAHILGKRESRRLLGDVILQEQDIVERREFPDAAAVTTWSIDIHYPCATNAEQFSKEKAFRAEAKFFHHIDPYPIPYRCLYSRNIENLFMAGRDVSVTHVALGSVRVMYTGGIMGEVVAMAASLCKKHDVTPRMIYTDHLSELKGLMETGAGNKPVPEEPPWEDVNFLPGSMMRKYRAAREALGPQAEGLGVQETIRAHEP